MPTPTPPQELSETADLIITWSGVILAAFALLIAVLAILFAGAGFLGIRELRSIRQAGVRARNSAEEQVREAQALIEAVRSAGELAVSQTQTTRQLAEEANESARYAEEQNDLVRQGVAAVHEAIRALDERLSSSVEVSYLFNQAEAAYRDGQYEKTVEHLRRAVEIDPRNVRIHYRLGRAFTNLSNDLVAVQHFDEALRLGMPDGAPQRGLALAYRYSDAGRALNFARQATEKSPETAPSWNILGLILRDNGHFDEAEVAHSQAKLISPGSAATSFYLSLLAAQAKAYTRALEYSGAATDRLESEERLGRLKPMWAAIVRWGDDILKGSYADADASAEVLHRLCPSARRGRELIGHIEFLLRALGREEYLERYVGGLGRWRL